MPAEGVAVVERRRAVPERLVDAVADDRRADRGVAARHPLGAGDHVGHVAVLVAGEHVADAAEGADDLVADEQHVVLVADLAHPLEVAGRGREASAGVLHRLEEDRGDRLGALEQDHLLDAVRGPDAELGSVACPDEAHLLGAVVVGVRHAEAAGGDRLEHLLHRRDAGDRERALRGAVVGDGARDDLVLGRAALQLPVVLGELERGLDRLAAAGGEEDAVEVAGRVVGEPVGELDGGGMRVRPDREERELLGLLRGGLGEALAAVAGVHDEEAGQAVDVLLARRVPDVVALALDDDRHAVAPRPTDWREKCIQRWSLAFCCRSASVVLSASVTGVTVVSMVMICSLPGSPVVELLVEFQIDEGLGGLHALDRLGSAC